MSNSNIVDFVEYKLNNWLSGHPAGTFEREVAESIMQLYRDGMIRVTWKEGEPFITTKGDIDIFDEILK